MKTAAGGGGLSGTAEARRFQFESQRSSLPGAEAIQCDPPGPGLLRRLRRLAM